MTPNKTANTSLMMALMLGVFTTGCAMQNPSVPAAANQMTNPSAMIEDQAQGPAIAQTVGAEVKSYSNSYNDKSKKSMKSKKSKKSMKSKKSHKSYKSNKSAKSYSQKSTKPYPSY